MAVSAKMKMELDRLFQFNHYQELFLRNSFRVLGLQVDATNRQVTRKAQLTRMQYELGTPGGTQNDEILPILNIPDDFFIQEAVNKLGQPEIRFLEEIFWFWPMAGDINNDNALKALASNNYQDAVNIWLDNEQQADNKMIATHNLAVIAHTLALDIEHIKDCDPSVNGKYEMLRYNYWKSAYARWQIVISMDEFWRHLTNRMVEIDDPRIKEDDINAMHDLLPYILISTSAFIALKAVERDQHEEASTFLELINGSSFHQEAINESLQHTVAAHIEQVNTAYTNADSEIRQKPASAAEVIRQTIDETAKPYQVIRTMLPEKHPGLVSFLDKTAERILQFVIRYTNETNDWNAALELLEYAQANSGTQKVKNKIAENLKACKDIIATKNCWFCQKAFGDDQASIEVQMYGEVNKTPTILGTRITWRQLKIKVPRCKRCEEIHTQRGSAITLGGITGITVGIILWVILANSVYSSIGFLAFLSFSVAGFVFSWLIERTLEKDEVKEIKARSTANDFPLIKEHLAKGWAFGEKPPEASQNN
jgi:hypothetical protein